MEAYGERGKNMNGGYAMIDCTGLDLIKGETVQTIATIYDRVKTAMSRGKPLMACNCVWDGIPVSPIYTFAIQIATNRIICTASTLQIIINSDDTITINNMAPASN